MNELEKLEKEIEEMERVVENEERNMKFWGNVCISAVIIGIIYLIIIILTIL